MKFQAVCLSLFHQLSWDPSLSPGFQCLIPDVLDLNLHPPGFFILPCPSHYLPYVHIVSLSFWVFLPSTFMGLPLLCLCSLSFFQIFMVEKTLCGSGLSGCTWTFVILIAHTVTLLCALFHRGFEEFYFAWFEALRIEFVICCTDCKAT